MSDFGFCFVIPNPPQADEQSLRTPNPYVSGESRDSSLRLSQNAGEAPLGMT
jgi:hypothetical protein